MPDRALKAYEAAGRTSVSSRELEANALTRAARLLEQCRANWDAADRAERLDEALKNNQKLWTFFQAQLAEPENPLPAEIRVNLLRLSGYVDRRIFEIIADPQPEKIQVLIDINRNVAAGLNNDPGPGVAGAPAEREDSAA